VLYSFFGYHQVSGCKLDAKIKASYRALDVTSQDFIKFWGIFFSFVLLEMIGISQGFKTF
jgi:hypothetical protein